MNRDRLGQQPVPSVGRTLSRTIINILVKTDNQTIQIFDTSQCWG